MSEIFSKEELEVRALVNYGTLLKSNWTHEQLTHLRRRILQRREELTRKMREVHDELDCSFLELQAVGQYLQRLEDQK